MALSQKKSGRKPSGGRYKQIRKKKLYELGRQPTLTKLGNPQIKTARVSGGNIKFYNLASNIINLIDPATKKCTKAIIKTVTDNPANRNYVRRNILTKGTIVDTDKGRARITNRPGQEGTLNGVLVQ